MQGPLEAELFLGLWLQDNPAQAFTEHELPCACPVFRFRALLFFLGINTSVHGYGLENNRRLSGRMSRI
jgi:hypothetical protein